MWGDLYLVSFFFVIRNIKCGRVGSCTAISPHALRLRGKESKSLKISLIHQRNMYAAELIEHHHLPSFVIMKRTYQASIPKWTHVHVLLTMWVRRLNLLGNTPRSIDYYQGPDLYAFIGFIGPDDINYMCWTLYDQISILIINLYHHHQDI